MFNWGSGSRGLGFRVYGLGVKGLGPKERLEGFVSIATCLAFGRLLMFLCFNYHANFRRVLKTRPRTRIRHPKPRSIQDLATRRPLENLL